MGMSGNSDSKIKTNKLSSAVRDTIKRIAYEHSMNYEDAKTHYMRMRDE